MSDSRRPDQQRALEAESSAADREGKIEQLLLVGLEHYFAAEYDHAINVWTRALFLDRGHARARAYIERARSAQAERQRESEELLQRGVAAFHQGEAEEARRLLRDAMDQGAQPEEALAILERINRLAQVAPQPAPPPVRRGHVLQRLARRAPQPSRAAWLTIAALVLVMAVAGAFAAGAFRAAVGPLMNRPGSAGALPTRLSIDEGPPLPRRGETALARAQALFQGGRFRDALGALDGVRPTDLQHADADRLRTDIQKQLIGLMATPAPASEPTRPALEP